MSQYDHKKIEENWQKVWANSQTFKAENTSDKPKYYVLDMFPYPSGAGLHVGHPLGYIASDIVARYKRNKGFNVLHPMGYDAFGLPAEQYAIQTGQHPAITTEENIKRYREQLDRIGFSFDWSREIRTSDPQYYKWTQWIFIQLFNSWYNPTTDKAEPISELIKTFETNGYQSEELSFTAQEWQSYTEKQQSDILLQFRLAFLSETMVNWCPALGSVLANDEIKDGVSERGGYPVERKLMYQWSLRISVYAERLLQGLNGLDWTESIKEAQRNWIGKSEGCSVRFELASPLINSGEIEKDSHLASPLTPLQRRGELDADFSYLTSDKKIYPKLVEFAKEHRSKPTNEEEKVWEVIRNRQIQDTKFRRQHIIDKFIADFVCLELNLIIEIDGLIHSLEDNLISDEARTIRLNELGFEVIRFTNEKVNSNIETVISKLEKIISEKKSSSPSLLEKGLGDEVRSPSLLEKGLGDEALPNSLEVFTTRPDTIFGVSYMAIAPEHELLNDLCVGEFRDTALQYAEKAKNRSERERQAEVKNITGAFTGSYVKHPFTGKQIPIWIADYVLGGYGTGAVMAVPAHDGRDFAFAKHFGLPILEVVQGGDKDKNEVLDKLQNTSPLSNNSSDGEKDSHLTSPLTPLQRRGELDADSPFGYYTTDKITYSKLIDFAKEHRSKPTKEEEKVWEVLRSRQIQDTKFRRQHIIDKFIADFVCLELNLIIEIDGLIHSLEDNLISDEARTIRLNELGFEVIRFTNEEVNSRIETVISKLEKIISEKKSSSPSLLEKGLGDEVRSPSLLEKGLGDEVKKEVKEPYEAKHGKVINSDFLNGLEVKEAIKAAIKAIEQKGIGKGKTNYRLRDAVFGRQRYWGEPIPVYYENGIPKTFDEKDLPLVLPEIDKYLPTETGEPPLSRAKDWTYSPNLNKIQGFSSPSLLEKGLGVEVLSTSPLERGLGGEAKFPIETTTMPGWAGSSWYFLRYMDHNNAQELVSKQAVDYWQNIDLYIGGSEHATGHLLYFRFWTKFLHDIGVVPFDEPAKKLVNQGMIQGVSPFLRGVHTVTYSKSFVSLNEIEQQKLIFELKKDTTNEKHIRYVSKDYLSNYIEYENSVEVIVSEYVHLRLPLELEIDNSFIKEEELLRLVLDLDLPNKINYFPNKFLKRFFEESIVFEKDKNNNKVIQIIWEVEKMSKSKWNVVNPDDVCNEYGADTLRLYEMFLGPLQDAKPWSTQGIEGVLRFLRKLWRLFHQGDNETFLMSDEIATKAELKILHKTIKKATEDIENFSFNTSVSAFMVCVNELQDLKCNKREILEPLITLLSPYAPHICEELYALCGHHKSVNFAEWPVFNPDYLIENEFNYPISFNGKVRFNLLFALDKELKEIENEVLVNEQTLKYLEGKPAKKVIVVKGKIVNVVI